jgi:hypothetical protein
VTDLEWLSLVRQYRRAKGWAPLTPAEARRAYDEAPSVPIGEERIRQIVGYATGHDVIRIGRPANPEPPDVRA